MQLYCNLCNYMQLYCNLCNLCNYIATISYATICNYATMQHATYATLCNYMQLGVAISTLCNFMTDRCGNFNFMQLNETIWNCVESEMCCNYIATYVTICNYMQLMQLYYNLCNYMQLMQLYATILQLYATRCGNFNFMQLYDRSVWQFQLYATKCNYVGTILQLMQLYATYATILQLMQLYATIWNYIATISYATICKYATI